MAMAVGDEILQQYVALVLILRHTSASQPQLLRLFF